jgi:hypothetical protein
MKTIFYSFIYGMIFILLISFIYRSCNSEGFLKERYNEQLEELKSLVINSVVKNKYVDEKNHNFPIIVFINDKKFNLIHTDTIGLYNYIIPNDSIVKEKNSDTVCVFRGLVVKKFKLECGYIEN